MNIATLISKKKFLCSWNTAYWWQRSDCEQEFIFIFEVEISEI
jgi:hypothetical protein